MGTKHVPRRQVSRTYQGVLRTGFHLNLFRGTVIRRGGDLGALFKTRGSATLRVTRRSVILLGGRNVLPISISGCGGVLIAKPGTSDSTVLKS